MEPFLQKVHFYSFTESVYYETIRSLLLHHILIVSSNVRKLYTVLVLVS